MSDPTSPLEQFGGPPVDPRFRRRWAEARRAEGRRRLRVLLLVVAATVLVGGGFGLLYSPVFRVRHVFVVGNVHTPTSQVLAAAEMAPGDPSVLMVDAGPPSAVRAIDALPWVAAASFERRWPWTVVIQVKERSPVAGLFPSRSSRSEDLVDESGRVLAVSPTLVPTLPVIIGVQGAPPGAQVSPRTGLDQPEVAELLDAAAAAPRPLAQRGLRLAYSAASGLVGYVGSAQTEVLLGDSSELAAKLAVLQELAGRVDLAGYSQADLTVPERPALTPLPSGVLATG
jgi:cell division protein FtsQ